MDGKYHVMNQRSTQSTMRCKFSAKKKQKQKQIDLTSSQNGRNRPNLTDLEAQCQLVGCDPFCSRC